MTLEVLFAQALQGRTFLLMMLCGAGMSLLVQLAGFLHHPSRLLGMAADLLCAVALALVLGWILLGCGEGLRLYGLLGLTIGCLLYSAGPGRLLGWLAQRCSHTEATPPQETPPQP